MEKVIYSAIFTKEIDDIGYSIQFYDLPGAISQGDTLSEGITMAKECLELMVLSILEDEEELPVPTLPECIKLDENQFIVPIEISLDLLRHELHNKAVRKNVTIPFWLCKEAEKQNVNFSAILQVALKDYLNVK